MQLNAPPKAGSKSSEFVDVPLVITAVNGEKEVETSLGDATATSIDILVLEWSGFPGDADRVASLRHVPDVLIFWNVVQRQLLSDDFAPPVAGYFTQKGKAYTLEPLDDATLATVSSLLGDDGDDMRYGEGDGSES